MVRLTLGAAIPAEVTATLALRGGDCLARLWRSMAVVVGYAVADTNLPGNVRHG